MKGYRSSVLQHFKRRHAPAPAGSRPLAPGPSTTRRRFAPAICWFHAGPGSSKKCICPGLSSSERGIQ